MKRGRKPSMAFAWLGLFVGGFELGTAAFGPLHVAPLAVGVAYLIAGPIAWLLGRP